MYPDEDFRLSSWIFLLKNKTKQTTKTFFYLKEWISALNCVGTMTLCLKFLSGCICRIVYTIYKNSILFFYSNKYQLWTRELENCKTGQKWSNLNICTQIKFYWELSSTRRKPMPFLSPSGARSTQGTAGWSCSISLPGKAMDQIILETISKYTEVNKSLIAVIINLWLGTHGGQTRVLGWDYWLGVWRKSSGCCLLWIKQGFWHTLVALYRP